MSDGHLNTAGHWITDDIFLKRIADYSFTTEQILDCLHRAFGRNTPLDVTVPTIGRTAVNVRARLSSSKGCLHSTMATTHK